MFPRTQLNVSTEDNCTTNSEPPPSRPTSLGLDLDDSAKLGRVDTLKIDIGVRREGGNWLRVEHWARNTKQSRLFLPRAAATLKQRKHRVPSMSKLSTSILSAAATASSTPPTTPRSPFKGETHRLRALRLTCIVLKKRDFRKGVLYRLYVKQKLPHPTTRDYYTPSTCMKKAVRKICPKSPLDRVLHNVVPLVRK